MEKINIEGKEYSLEEIKKALSLVKSPMDEVFAFHKTSGKGFEEQYKNVSEFAKNQEIERMIVNFYNKGEQCDWNNTNQKKWYPWFYLGDNFSFGGSDDCFSSSFSSARLCFLRESDLKEAVVKFKEQYRNSRNK